MKYLTKLKFFTESKKYLKTYENNIPQIGDYVILEPLPNRFGLSKEWRDFVKCHIGRIIKKYYATYTIEYQLPENFTETINGTAEEIKEFSKNRKNLEYIETANEYNL